MPWYQFRLVWVEGAIMRINEQERSRVGCLVLLLCAPLLMGTTWPTVPPEELADVIVILVPAHDHALHVPAPVERPIKGQILRLEKGQFEKGPLPEPEIIHKPNTIGGPLKDGVPTKLCLKKFPDRNAYYPICVEPLKQGGRK